jgi:hypothetical protein
MTVFNTGRGQSPRLVFLMRHKDKEVIPLARRLVWKAELWIRISDRFPEGKRERLGDNEASEKSA